MRAALMTASAVGLACAVAATASAKTLYVSPHGSDSHRCTKKAPCKTIKRAVRLAHTKDTVKVRRGTYAEMVKITKDISLVGARGAVVNATGLQNGVLIKGASAAGASVSGLVVKGATFEGILAVQTGNVTIASNTVKGNDLGAAAATPVGECAAQGQIPGDCGEGLHLMTVSNATVTGNSVTGNTGGILMTDELGPSAKNQITNNHVFNNLYDCGITIAGHSTQAVSTSTGKPQPTLAGIYNNTISGNTSTGNGTKGEGAGILLAASAPGAGVYDNVVENNTTSGNSLGGIVLHSHTPLQDIDGNQLTGNHITADGGMGDPEFGQTGTVGIVVASAVTKLKQIKITGNVISNVQTGIFTKNAPNVPKGANTFANVTTPISQN
jgi:parallel beta-helix repeat protein